MWDPRVFFKTTPDLGVLNTRSGVTFFNFNTRSGWCYKSNTKSGGNTAVLTGVTFYHIVLRRSNVLLPTVTCATKVQI